jgi:hypothetical protein
MNASPLSPDEQAVIDALQGSEFGEGEELRLHAFLDLAVHRLEERGWINVTSRGALIADQREYMLSLTPEGKLALDDLAPAENI